MDPSISKEVQEAPDRLEKEDAVQLLRQASNSDAPGQNDALQALTYLFYNKPDVAEQIIDTDNETVVHYLHSIIDNLQSESRSIRELTGDITTSVFDILIKNDEFINSDQFQQLLSEANHHGVGLLLLTTDNIMFKNACSEIFQSCNFTPLVQYITDGDENLLYATSKFITNYRSSIDDHTQKQLARAAIRRLESSENSNLIEVVDNLEWPEDVLSEIVTVCLQLLKHDDETVREYAVEWSKAIAGHSVLDFEPGNPIDLHTIVEEYDEFIYDDNGDIRPDVFVVYCQVIRSEEILSRTPYTKLTTHRRILIEALDSEDSQKTAARAIVSIAEHDKDIFVKSLPDLVDLLSNAESDWIRSEAGHAIWLISKENPDVVSSTIPSLIQSLDDPSARTVEMVLYTIEDELIDECIDDLKPAVPRLLELLDDDRGYKRVSGPANGVFGRIAGNRPAWVVPYVPDLLSLAEEHPPVLSHVETIAEHEPEQISEYADTIEQFLGDDRSKARKYACSIAGEITLLPVIDTLGEISREDPEPTVREAADEAINTISQTAADEIARKSRDPNTNALEFSSSPPSPEPIVHEVPFFIEQISDKILLALDNGDTLDLHIYFVELVDFIRGHRIDSADSEALISRLESILNKIEREREQEKSTISQELDEEIRREVNKIKKKYLKG